MGVCVRPILGNAISEEGAKKKHNFKMNESSEYIGVCP